MLHLFRDSGMTLFHSLLFGAMVLRLCSLIYLYNIIAATSPLSIQFTTKYLIEMHLKLVELLAVAVVAVVVCLISNSARISNEF